MTERILAIVRRQLERAHSCEAARDFAGADYYQWIAAEWLTLAIGGSQ